MNTYDVSLVSCEGYDDRQVETALRAVLEPIHGLDFVHPGMTVGIKVNRRKRACFFISLGLELPGKSQTLLPPAF